MTDDEIKDAIAAAVDEATKGLKTKNSELISANKALKDQASAADDEKQRLADEAAAKSGDLDKIKEAHAREIKKRDETIAARDATLATMLIDNAISAKTAESGIFPHLSKAFAAMMKAEAKVVDGQAMVGDQNLSDHMTAYLASGEGKNFYPAAANGGGGATGSTAKATAWLKPPTTGTEITEYTKYAIANPAEANALADSWNMPHLKV